MRAAVVTEPGGPEVFRILDVEDPVPGPDDVLVDIKATALNRADLGQRRRNPAPNGSRGDVLGLEMAGTVASVGQRVDGIAIGERVFGLLGGGGYAFPRSTAAQCITGNHGYNRRSGVRFLRMSCGRRRGRECRMDGPGLHFLGTGNAFNADGRGSQSFVVRPVGRGPRCG